MTTCPCAEDLYLYLEGELGPDDLGALETHLERCPACRKRLAERRLLHEAFTSLPPFEVPPDFALSVMDRLPEPAEARPRGLAPLVAATASLVFGLLGFYLLTGQSLSDVLFAFNRSIGTAFSSFLPFLAKLWKLGGILLRVASGALSTLGKGLGLVSNLLGPEALGLVVCLGVLLTLLLLYGAKRLLSMGEQS